MRGSFRTKHDVYRLFNQLSKNQEYLFYNGSGDGVSGHWFSIFYDNKLNEWFRQDFTETPPIQLTKNNMVTEQGMSEGLLEPSLFMNGEKLSYTDISDYVGVLIEAFENIIKFRTGVITEDKLNYG